MKTFTVNCDKVAFFDITEEVGGAIQHSGVTEGLCVVTVDMPTAAVVLAENSDKLVQNDILNDLEQILPARANYIEHSDIVKTAAYAKSAITGPSLDLIIKNGKPVLGRYQNIYVANYYYGTTCAVNVQCIGAS